MGRPSLSFLFRLTKNCLGPSRNILSKDSSGVLEKVLCAMNVSIRLDLHWMLWLNTGSFSDAECQVPSTGREHSTGAYFPRGRTNCADSTSGVLFILPDGEKFCCVRCQGIKSTLCNHRRHPD